MNSTSQRGGGGEGKFENNKQRKIIPTASRERERQEGQRKKERRRVKYIICQELSVLVAICWRIPRVARQLCLCLSGLNDNTGMDFCATSDVPTSSGSIRRISSDVKNLFRVFPRRHSLVCHRPFPYIFRCSSLLRLPYPDLAFIWNAYTLSRAITSV
jgi:hypothetical protein